MTKLSDIPCWYYGIAVVLSGYQAYRGFMFQWINSDGRKYGQRELNIPMRVLLLCIADMFTYFICAFTGAIALFVAYDLLWASPAPATTAVIIFLAVYGVLGITAKLPELLPKIKFP